MAATMGATVYWMRETTPLYTADALIAIETRPSSIVRVDSIVQVDQATQDTGGDAAQINTELAVLQSRGLAARVIRALGLDKDPEFALEDAENDDAATEVRTRKQRATGFLHMQIDLLAFAYSALDSAKSFLTGARADDNAAHGAGRGRRDERQQSADLLGRTDEREAAALLARFLGSLSVEAEDNSRLIRIGFHLGRSREGDDDRQ